MKTFYELTVTVAAFQAPSRRDHSPLTRVTWGSLGSPCQGDRAQRGRHDYTRKPEEPVPAFTGGTFLKHHKWLRRGNTGFLCFIHGLSGFVPIWTQSVCFLFRRTAEINLGRTKRRGDPAWRVITGHRVAPSGPLPHNACHIRGLAPTPVSETHPYPRAPLMWVAHLPPTPQMTAALSTEERKAQCHGRNLTEKTQV